MSFNGLQWFVGSIAVTLLLVAHPSVAQAKQDDADTEFAKRHFERGRALYAGSHYDEALREFRQALFAKPLAAFHYNIAKCHDRLEHYDEAIAAYERYLAAAKAESDISAVRARIEQLRIRASLIESSSNAPTSTILRSATLAERQVTAMARP